MNVSLDIGVLIGLLTATIGGLWSVRKVLDAKRADQAAWLHKLFVDFYLREEFRPLRKMLEYGDNSIAALIERRVSRRELTVDSSEADLLCSLDSFLNYLELLFTLEQEGQIHRRGRDAVFRYWNDVLCLPQNSALRRYLDRFGFEAIVEVLPAQVVDSISKGEEYFALYGSLTRFGGKQAEANIDQRLDYVGSCEIPGQIVDLGDYPGLIESEGQVQAELFKSSDPEVFLLLDKFEKFSPDDPKASLFLRKCVWLPSCGRDCWVYYLNGPRENAVVIPSGDWQEHRGA